MHSPPHTHTPLPTTTTLHTHSPPHTNQRHGVYLHGDVTALLMSIAMLEGLLEQLDPEFDMMQEAVPYIVRYKFDAVAEAVSESRDGSGMLFRVLSAIGII